jgi:hypothetical protein
MRTVTGRASDARRKSLPAHPVMTRITHASLVCALGAALAACGSSSPRSTEVPGSAKLHFSECMRSRGVSNFPDPSSSPPSGPVSTVFGIAIPSNINLQSPAFQSALQSCAKLITGGAPKPASSATQIDALVRHARCMRTRCAPNYPDPKVSGGGIRIGFGPGVNPQSPAFQVAAGMCGSR